METRAALCSGLQTGAERSQNSRQTFLVVATEEKQVETVALAKLQVCAEGLRGGRRARACASSCSG